MGHIRQRTIDSIKEIIVGRGASMLPLWLYFLAITSAELLTVYLDPLVGVVCHGMILVALLIQSAFVADSERRNLILGLSLVPLIRILSMAMPLVQLTQIYWYPIIYAPLLVATLAMMRVVKLKPSDIGLVCHDLLTQIIIGISSGLVYGIMEYIILRPNPLVTDFTLQQLGFPAVVLLITTGLVEEIMFRGVLQRLAEPVMGFWQGAIYISLIFAILHVGFFSAVDIIFVLIVALSFAYTVKQTRSLIGVILAHGIANILLYLVMPFMLR
jgi:hypothetical protein